jgi:NADP-dependent aldehyde dehydrogenase
MSQRILITGAAGFIGQILRESLPKPDRILRLVDIAELPAAGQDENVEIVQGDFTDSPMMLQACRGVDAVVHLGAIAHESEWEKILHTNIHGTYAVLEAARQAGVPRVVLASSNHAVGFHPITGEGAPDYLFPRPDTFYGISKVTAEALGSMYHDRHGMDILCARIGSCTAKPMNHRSLSTWLSPGDCGRLMEALLSTPSPGFRIVWGISANTRSYFSLQEARELGYQPEDDAESSAEVDLISTTADVPERFIGGSFTE